MKKNLMIMICLILICSLAGCRKNKTDNKPAEENTTNDSTANETVSDDTINKKLSLKIGNTEVDVFWANNDSVKELKKMAKNALTIELELYGGFEQFGSLGVSIPSNDITITANCGDIMLYQSNKIVLFYGSNTYSYTQLGHINLRNTEITELLSEESVTITISLK